MLRAVNGNSPNPFQCCTIRCNTIRHNPSQPGATRWCNTSARVSQQCAGLSAPMPHSMTAGLTPRRGSALHCAGVGLTGKAEPRRTQVESGPLVDYSSVVDVFTSRNMVQVGHSSRRTPRHICTDWCRAHPLPRTCVPGSGSSMRARHRDCHSRRPRRSCSTCSRRTSRRRATSRRACLRST